jgi:hypothetical protein
LSFSYLIDEIRENKQKRILAIRILFLAFGIFYDEEPDTSWK